MLRSPLTVDRIPAKGSSGTETGRGPALKARRAPGAVRAFCVGLSLASASAGGAASGVAGQVCECGAASLPDTGRVYASVRERMRVVPLTDELERPSSLAFLPDGTVLVAEREGRLRLVRGARLDPRPVDGVPEVRPQGSLGRRNGLLDIALHPRFERSRLLYLTYTKPGSRGAVTTALARARYGGGYRLDDVEDVFVAENWTLPDISQTAASRILFGPDGALYMSVGAPNASASSGPLSEARGGRAQDPRSHGGKVLRLEQDGSVPWDNPFVGAPDHLPEIFTLGHRNPMGLVVRPASGRIWLSEAGPRDGDEINVLEPGANYGWPVVGIGRDYSGDFIGGPVAVGDEAGREHPERFWLEGMKQPYLFWAPAVTPAGITFYTGDAFPGWEGDLFVATLTTRRLERYAFNHRGQPLSRPEYLLEDLGQRIRDVRQGPDGLLYVLTDHDAVHGADTTSGMLLRIEPVEPGG